MKSENNGIQAKALFNWVAYMRGFLNDFWWIYLRGMERGIKWSFRVAVNSFRTALYCISRLVMKKYIIIIHYN